MLQPRQGALAWVTALGREAHQRLGTAAHRRQQRRSQRGRRLQRLQAWKSPCFPRQAVCVAIQREAAQQRQHPTLPQTPLRPTPPLPPQLPLRCPPAAKWSSKQRLWWRRGITHRARHSRGWGCRLLCWRRWSWGEPNGLLSQLMQAMPQKCWVNLLQTQLTVCAMHNVGGRGVSRFRVLQPPKGFRLLNGA